MLHNTVHTKKFVNNWKKIVARFYNYEEYMDYLIIPSLSKKNTLSYLPLLNYTDRLSNDTLDLLELSKNNQYQIRVLNSEYTDFKDYDTVTMRLDISCYDSDKVFNEIIQSKCRNQIRKSKKSNLEIKFGNVELLNDFYMLFFNTMHKYGTPVLSQKLFESILLNMDSSLIIVYKDNIPIAGLLLMIDNDIAIVPWAASDSKYNKHCPNHLAYFSAIEYAIGNKCKIFDFGRSGYNTSPTFSFKKQWGSQPVKIDIISSEKNDIYSKYEFASKIWIKLPRSIVNFIGPRLCKYLVDL